MSDNLQKDTGEIGNNRVLKAGSKSRPNRNRFDVPMSRAVRFFQNAYAYMLAEINTTMKQPSEKYGDFLKNPHEEPAVSQFSNVVLH